MTLTEKLGAKALRALSHLPLWWLYRISDLLFPLLYHVVRYRRKVVGAKPTEKVPPK